MLVRIHSFERIGVTPPSVSAVEIVRCKLRLGKRRGHLPERQTFDENPEPIDVC